METRREERERDEELTGVWRWERGGVGGQRRRRRGTWRVRARAARGAAESAEIAGGEGCGAELEETAGGALGWGGGKPNRGQERAGRERMMRVGARWRTRCNFGFG